MTDIAIRAEKLSKLYHIGRAQQRPDSLRDALSAVFKRTKLQSAAHEGELWALRDVCFEVRVGEVIGVIGRNGAGKSTLLKILSRITEPTSGRVELHGRVASLLEVGTGFHPELTGRDNIYLNGAILGMKRNEIERKFDEIVAFAEIEQFLDTPVKRYSSGMYVRLAFAVAAHLEPEILLVDEVLAVGDTAFQRKCLGKMGEVAREGRTILFVSHNMAALLNLCPRAILLQAGQIIRHGKTDELISDYVVSGLVENSFDPSAGEQVGDRRACIADFTVHPNPPHTGEPVEFIFCIDRPASQGITSTLVAELAVSFLSEQGNPLFQLFSRHMGVEFEFAPGRTQSAVSLDALPLAPGRYLLSLWLGTGATPIDWRRDGFVLNVESGRLAGGEYVESRGYPVVAPATWRRVSNTSEGG